MSPLKNHEHDSARARTDRRGKMLGIKFSGAISQASADVLDRRILPDRRGAKVSFERLDTALTLFMGPAAVKVENFPPWTPTSVVIVRDDQYEHQVEISRQMALLGLTRLPFLTSQLAWAQAFAERVAAEPH